MPPFLRTARHWYRAQPVPLRLLLIVTPLLIGTIVDEVLKRGKAATGLPEWLIATLVLGTLLLLAAASAALFRASRPGSFPPIDFDNLEVQRRFSREKLERIRRGLHSDIYHDVAPVGDEITKMYERNPGMGVALFDTTREEYVGFATAWPLDDDCARKLIAGTISENDLVSDNILPESANGTANYVLVPAFGVTCHASDAERKYLGKTLYYEFRRVLRENFFSSGDRLLTMIASGFSEDGERWCRVRHMREESQVHMDGKLVPVFSKRISLDDVR